MNIYIYINDMMLQHAVFYPNKDSPNESSQQTLCQVAAPAAPAPRWESESGAPRELVVGG